MRRSQVMWGNELKQITLWPWDSCYDLWFLLQQCQETKTVVLLHLNIRPMTPSASYSGFKEKLYQSSYILCRLKESQMQALCVQAIILYGRNPWKSTITMNWSIQQGRFLNILSFLIEKVHSTLLRLWPVWVRQEIFLNLDIPCLHLTGKSASRLWI